MTDPPRLELPFDEVEKWEKIEGSCARFYAAAEWGYKKGLKEQRSTIIRELVDQVASPIPDDCRYDVFNRQLDIRAKLLAIATELTNSTRETLTVQLTYFKASGKYYTKGSFKTPTDTSLIDVWEEVKQMRKAGNLPGLVEGAQEFNILINVPGHRHEHPRFLMLP